MKRAFYIIGGLTLAISIPSALQAQTTQPKDTTMNRTVVVEQEYNPDIMDASKVNVLPKVEEPTVSKKNVEYATTFFPATSERMSLSRAEPSTTTQSSEALNGSPAAKLSARISQVSWVPSELLLSPVSAICTARMRRQCSPLMTLST